MRNTTESVDTTHRHRIEGYPVRMTPGTKPNIAWRCACGYFQLNRAGKGEWNPPASDEQIRLRWLEAFNG